MKKRIIKALIIAIIIVINFILIILVINSTKNYIGKIKNGDIIQNIEDTEEYEDLDLKSLANQFSLKLIDNVVFKITLLVFGILLLIIGIIVYLKI